MYFVRDVNLAENALNFAYFEWSFTKIATKGVLYVLTEAAKLVNFSHPLFLWSKLWEKQLTVA